MFPGLIIGIAVVMAFGIVAAMANLSNESRKHIPDITVTTAGAAFLVAVLALAAGYLLGLFLAQANTNMQWRQEAIDRGVGEYFLNENNRAEWRWTVEAQSSPEATQ